MPKNTDTTGFFRRELEEEHQLENAEFFVDGAPWLRAGFFELEMHLRHETRGKRYPLERDFREMKRRSNRVETDLPNADRETVVSWHKAPTGG